MSAPDIETTVGTSPSSPAPAPAAARQPVADSGYGAATLEPMTNLVTPFAIRVAATLCLADAMAEGVHDVAALAARCGADPGVLRRLLRHLCTREVFTERPDGGFEVGPAGGQLLSTHPMSMRAILDAETFAGRADASLAAMLHSVRTGTPAYEETFGRTYWEDLGERPVMAASLEAGLEVMASYAVRPLLRGYPWKDATLLMDVGGGSGALMCRLLRAFPHLRAVLIDLPYPLEQAVRIIEAAGVSDRAEVRAGDYHESVPSGADVYLLSHVLDQEHTEEAVAILRRCVRAGGPGAAVLLLQTPVTPGNEATMTMLDLRMLTIVGGQERTLEEYRELGERAGLRLTSTFPPVGDGPAGVTLIAFEVCA
jgi:hypothetical protein